MILIHMHVKVSTIKAGIPEVFYGSVCVQNFTVKYFNLTLLEIVLSGSLI